MIIRDVRSVLMALAWSVGVFGGLQDARAGACESYLTNRADVSVSTPGNNYDIYYEGNSSSTNYYPALNAGWLRDGVVLAHNFYVNSNGFQNPYFYAAANDICATRAVGCFADATPGQIRVRPGSDCMNSVSRLMTQTVIAHELFHTVQFSYITFNEWPSWGAWTIEATPMTMQDRVEWPMDSNSEGKAYVNYINGMLLTPNKTLTDRSYETGVFWSYLCEQFSSDTTEPVRGAELIRDFWRRCQGNSPDSIKYLRELLAARVPDRTLEEVFLDFHIAGYVRKRDLTALTADQRTRYVFVDETPAGGGTPYANVTVSNVTLNTDLSDSVKRWGVAFYDVTFTNAECNAVGVRAKARDNKIMAWSAIAMCSNKVVEIGRGVGNSFYRAFLNNPDTPYTKLALVAMGINNDATIDYAFGSGQTGGEIREPSTNRVAVVGEFTERRRFQVRVVVTGPPSLTSDIGGSSSVRGLDVSRMKLSLISSTTSAEYPATIVSGTYVSGEYWLVVEAPEITNPGDGTLYGLRLCLCERSGACQSSLSRVRAVYYGPVQYNQMLVLDRSYSMHYPNGPGDTPNIEAARNAARVFADAAATNDRLGLVTFNGNNSECNNDAALNASLKQMQDGATDNRTSLVAAIDAVVESGWTSIGDGLKQGRDAILGATIGSNDINGLVLLSDGLENEGDFWAVTNVLCSKPPVRDSFNPDTGIAANIRIDTIAFGEHADQGLLQSIADYTRGTFYAVRNNAPSAPLPSSMRLLAGSTAAGAPPPLNSLYVANRLAHVHRQSQEALRGQERIFYRGYDMTNVTRSFIIPVNELGSGGVRDAVFAFNWHQGSTVTITLKDPDANTITNGGDWQVYQTSTHKVYQHRGLLPSGDYSVRHYATTPAQMIAMLSGRVEHGVDFQVQLSSPQRVMDSRCPAEAGRYMRGLPVDVSAQLVDHKGPITGLRLEARIENPDGSINRISLYDDGLHDNGVGGDGVYGGSYTRTPFYSQAMLADSTNAPTAGEWGSYSVEVTAIGTSGYGDNFERFDTRFFHVYEFPVQGQGEYCRTDVDGDQIPDRWESFYGLNPADPADANADPDRDGLINKDEFKYGTLPFNPDTDGAGESDRSEVNGGRDPLYDQDDELPPIIDYGVVARTYHIPEHEPQPNTLILHYPANTNYFLMEIWRRDPGTTNWVMRYLVDPRAAPAAGVFYDAGLSNGSTYAYYLVAQGLSGAQTAPTDIFFGIPKADPVPPEGTVMINMDDIFASLRKVSLRFSVSEDATNVIVSEDPLFVGASYTNFATVMDFWLAPATNGPRVATVYAKVRDAAGNESQVMSDSIRLDENGDTDNDGLQDAWELIRFGGLGLNGGSDPDGDGFTNAQEFRNDTNPTNRLSPIVGSVGGVQPVPGGQQLLLNFQGNLFRSTNVAGPYIQVPDAVTPYSHPVTNRAEYFIAQ